MIPTETLIIIVLACEAILREKGFEISRPSIVDENYLRFLVGCLNALDLDGEL